MRLEIVDGPEVRAVSMERVYNHLKLNASGSPLEHVDDDLLDGYIRAAELYVEGFTHRKLISQTWRGWLDLFPMEILFPFGPIQSITQIGYVAEDGSTSVLASSQYVLDNKSQPGWVVPAYDVSWPTVHDVVNAVNITFVAGYGDGPEDIPADLQHAILMIVTHWYRNREAVTSQNMMEVPMAVKNLLADKKLWPRYQ